VDFYVIIYYSYSHPDEKIIEKEMLLNDYKNNLKEYTYTNLQIDIDEKSTKEYTV